MFSSTKHNLQSYTQHLKPYGFDAKKILGSGAFADVILAVQSISYYQFRFLIICLEMHKKKDD
jgi:hypothetical protein